MKYPAGYLTARGLGRGGAWRVLAPWMRRRVIRAGDAGDQDAVEAAWQAWLARPDDQIWQALQRWRRASPDPEFNPVSLVALGLPSTSWNFREALIRAAAREGHPISQIARERILAATHDQELVDAVCQAAVVAPAASGLGAWCAGQGLAPADRVDRAAFFVVTGQAAQYRAEDPDGSLLTLAYQAGTHAERERLRAVIADAGDLDLLRLVASAATSGPRPGTAGEARFLTGRLAARHDWDALWRLVRRLPLVQAVAAMPAFGNAWRPADEPGRELFARLAGAAPEPTAEARRALLASTVREIGRAPENYLVSISLDGRELALAGILYPALYLDLIELPSLVRRRRDVVKHWPAGVLHLGDGILIWNGFSVVRYTRDGAEDLYTEEVLPSAAGLRIRAARHYPGGFVALLSTGSRDPDRLRFATGSGQVIRDVALASLGISGEVRLCAADPGTGRLALSNGHFLWIVDGDPDSDRARALEVSGYAPLEAPLAGGSFAGPGRLVTSSLGRGRVDLWRLEGGRPEPQVTRWIRAVNRIATLGHGLVAVAEPQTLTGTVELLDSETLETLAAVTVPERFDDWRDRFEAAPGGRFLAVQQPGAFSLIDGGAVALACRPLHLMTAEHWALATGLLEDPGIDAAAGDFLLLLRDVLRLRLGGEVALGGAAPAGQIGAGPRPAGDDEIGL